MEVRCGHCNKLFRVSDDKITGRGVKFPCTRCGEYVKITQEDFQKYTLSRSSVPVPDLFEPKPGLPESPWSPTPEEPAVEVATENKEPMVVETAASSTHEASGEETAPLFVEPAQSETTAVTEPEPAFEPAHKEGDEEQAPIVIEPVQSETTSVTGPEPAVEPTPETLMPSEPEPPVEPQPEPRKEPEPLMAEKTTGPPARTLPVQMPQPALETSPVPASAVSSMEKSAVKEPPRPSAPSPSGRMVLVLLATLILLGLAGYGVFFYLQSAPQKNREEASREIISIEGLQIVNPAGAMDPKGDLLVTGVVENATGKERTAWCVVIEVNDAQGTVLSRIKIKNGNQIYSRRDYDVLAKRGANVQEIKEKILQGKGLVIPPMGRVNFEARYLQPPSGIASFVAQVVPFDREQLDKEIAEEMK